MFTISPSALLPFIIVQLLLLHFMQCHQHQQHQACYSNGQVTSKNTNEDNNNNLLCPPVVVGKQNDLTVGAGSNISLSCMARGTPPLTFVWFQDEKNLTTTKTSNASDQSPAVTKLLDERRYEITEESSPPGQPNTTTSILYLFNLQQSDTSIFLCWVENAAGFTMANFSLIVTDESPPAYITSRGTMVQSSGATSGFFSSWFGPKQAGETQMGIISIGFIMILVAIVILLLVYRHSSSRSSRSSTKSDDGATDGSGELAKSTLNNMSASTKFHHQRAIMIEEAANDPDYDSDSRSTSSGSSCNKTHKGIMSVSNLDGFIEQMRSGIINIDSYSMSPITSEYNIKTRQPTTKAPAFMNSSQAMALSQQQQIRHHFPSASNASSSVPYYGGGNGGRATAGSASMATTTSDLSPASSSGTASASSQTTNFVSNNPDGSTNLLANYDLLSMHQHQQPPHLRRPEGMAPLADTMETNYKNGYVPSYADDLSSGASNLIPPMYYDAANAIPDVMHATYHHHPNGAAVYHHQQQQPRVAPNGTLIGVNGHPLHEAQPNHLVLQDMMLGGGRLLVTSSPTSHQHQQPQQQHQKQRQQQRTRQDDFHIL